MRSRILVLLDYCALWYSPTCVYSCGDAVSADIAESRRRCVAIRTKTLLKAGDPCRHLIERTIARETGHHKSMESFDFCPIQRWRA